MSSHWCSSGSTPRTQKTQKQTRSESIESLDLSLSAVESAENHAARRRRGGASRSRKPSCASCAGADALAELRKDLGSHHPSAWHQSTTARCRYAPSQALSLWYRQR